jgi:putative protease
MISNKVELLAPAGDCNRGKIALDFGADAIYFGARQYSLRAKASNFGEQDIEEISKYAHERNKKIFLVTNILCHSHMANGFIDFFKSVQKYSPDAYICSDPYIVKTIHELNNDAQIHISTQQSVSNSKSALFWKRNGATRIILSREVTFSELEKLIKGVNNEIEIEVFIHGAVCIAYSGRCMLSNNFCFRDANIGGCAQSCR